jgi:hypothetical protein
MTVLASCSGIDMNVIPLRCFDKRICHQISCHIPGNTSCSNYVAHNLPIGAIHSEGYPHSLPVPTDDLEAIGAPPHHSHTVVILRFLIASSPRRGSFSPLPILIRAEPLERIDNRLHWISSSLVKGPRNSGFVPRAISITSLRISTSAAGYRGNDSHRTHTHPVLGCSHSSTPVSTTYF